jgi:hypothetical protein
VTGVAGRRIKNCRMPATVDAKMTGGAPSKTAPEPASPLAHDSALGGAVARGLLFSSQQQRLTTNPQQRMHGPFCTPIRGPDPTPIDTHGEAQPLTSLGLQWHVWSSIALGFPRSVSGFRSSKFRSAMLISAVCATLKRVENGWRWEGTRLRTV